jgi:DNA-binding NarL/FixJ family response regulator
MPIRVFLVDDQEVVRAGTRVFVEAAEGLTVVGEAGSVAEALDRLPGALPDVAVLDVRLPDGDGVELCREIRSAWPEVACIMLTTFDDDQALFSAIMAGASGYVLKGIRGRELAEAIRQVGSGGSLLDPASTRLVLERLRSGPAQDVRLQSLSKQERRVLDLVAEGCTNRQIAEAMFLSDKTIKNYVSSVMSKLGVERRTEAAVYAMRAAEKERSAGQPADS